VYNGAVKTALLVLACCLGGCNQTKDASATAPSASVAAAAAPGSAAPTAPAVATAEPPPAAVGTAGRGVAAKPDGGVTIAGNGKTVQAGITDGGGANLNLANQGGKGAVNVQPNGATSITGKNGKTLTLPGF
jgi:hypothetical protein